VYRIVGLPRHPWALIRPLHPALIGCIDRTALAVLTPLHYAALRHTVVPIGLAARNRAAGGGAVQSSRQVRPTFQEENMGKGNHSQKKETKKPKKDAKKGAKK
jgi:hypothetical protein